MLTNIDWSSPTTIGITVGIVIVVAVIGYLVWARSEGKKPF